MIYISTYIWWKCYISIWTFCVFFSSFCFLSPFLDGPTIFFCVYFIICYAGRCDEDQTAGHTGKSFRRGYFNCEISYMRMWHTMWIRENSNDRFKGFDHASSKITWQTITILFSLAQCLWPPDLVRWQLLWGHEKN